MNGMRRHTGLRSNALTTFPKIQSRYARRIGSDAGGSRSILGAWGGCGGIGAVPVLVPGQHRRLWYPVTLRRTAPCRFRRQSRIIVISHPWSQRPIRTTNPKVGEFGSLRAHPSSGDFRGSRSGREELHWITSSAAVLQAVR